MRIDIPTTEEFKIEVIKEEVSRHFDRTLKDILSRSRKGFNIIPRQCIMFFLDLHTDITLKKIGKEVDRDHSTVLHGIKSIQDRIDTQQDFKYSLMDLNEKILNRI